MARLWSCGFELNTTSEYDSVITGTNANIQNTVVRSGSYACQTTASSGTANSGGQNINNGSDSNGPFFFRYYIRIDTFSTIETTIISLRSGSGDGTPMVYITADNGGLLRLYDEDGQIGSASSALTSAKWYRIEIQYDRTAAAGSHIVNALIDGTQFAGATNRNLSAGIRAISWGINLKSEANAAGNIYFDDIAINDNTGSYNTSYPRDGGIIHLRPNAAGDNNMFVTQVGGTAGASNNYTRTNEVTPDDASSYNADTILNNVDDFNIDTMIGGTINLVQVGVRFSGLSSTSVSGFKLRIKNQSGGTINRSSEIVPNSTTWRTNGTVQPKNYPLTLYVDPNGNLWRKSTLDNTQIGYEISTSNTNAAAISTIWLLVDYSSISGPFPTHFYP